MSPVHTGLGAQPQNQFGYDRKVRDLPHPIPGQEERNSDHLLEAAAAIRCNNLPTLAYKLDRLLADPVRFATMQANVNGMVHPNAARDIVQKLLELS